MKKALRKKYRTFKSVDALLDAQEQIKMEYRDLEKNAVSNIFDPVQIGLSVVPAVFSMLRGSKEERKSRRILKRAEKRAKQELDAVKPLIGDDPAATLKELSPVQRQRLNIIDISRNGSFGKKVFASFIRWQLIEIGIWGIKKIIAKRK